MKITLTDKMVNADIIKLRRSRYGNNFPLIAALWRGFIKKRFNILLILNELDVSVMMALMKVSRLAYSPELLDTMLDFLNYMWIGLNHLEYLGLKE